MHHEARIDAPHNVGPYWQDRNIYVDAAAAIKKIARVPIGVINRISDAEFAEQILAEGKADFIWMGRALLVDPELPRKAAEGRLDEIRYCIGCNTCIDMSWNGFRRDFRCAVNPEAYRERMSQVLPVRRVKNVLVIGGGPAGAEAARTAARIGHSVTLWEKDDKLGGQVNLAMLTVAKQGYGSLISYYATQLKKLGVTVELGKNATADLIRKIEPNIVILASGSSPRIPPIPGVDRSNVVMANEVVAGKAAIGDRVAIIGGGVVGMETAQLLLQRGKKITLVARHKLGKHMVRQVYHHIRLTLERDGVEMLRFAPTEEITDGGIIIVDKDKNRRLIGADTVVLAAGAMPNRALLDNLGGIVPEVHLVGDCLNPRNIMSAIYQGMMVGRALDDYYRA
jgi:2,4-dienoyl-CoA reductase (NADPH2)